MVGSQMQQWALFWHISHLSVSPIAVSIVGGVRFGAVLAFSMIGGLAADRYNRRLILFITQSMSVGVALVLGLLTLLGIIQLWHIYVLTAIQAATMAFDVPARQSLVPNLVPREDLPNAFSLQSIGYNTGAIAGPALSGLIIAYWGQEWAYLLNAVSFLAVILALAMMGQVPQHQATARQGVRAALQDMRGGIRLHSRAAPDLLKHDLGLLCHVLCLGEHATTVLRPIRAACGGGRVRVACGRRVRLGPSWSAW